MSKYIPYRKYSKNGTNLKLSNDLFLALNGNPKNHRKIKSSFLILYKGEYLAGSVSTMFTVERVYT